MSAVDLVYIVSLWGSRRNAPSNVSAPPQLKMGSGLKALLSGIGEDGPKVQLGPGA